MWLWYRCNIRNTFLSCFLFFFCAVGVLGCSVVASVVLYFLVFVMQFVGCLEVECFHCFRM